MSEFGALAVTRYANDGDRPSARQSISGGNSTIYLGSVLDEEQIPMAAFATATAEMQSGRS